jgi:hypothetical protein
MVGLFLLFFCLEVFSASYRIFSRFLLVYLSPPFLVPLFFRLSTMPSFLYPFLTSLDSFSFCISLSPLHLLAFTSHRPDNPLAFTVLFFFFL